MANMMARSGVGHLPGGLGTPLVWMHCDGRARLDKLTALSEALLQADASLGVILSYPATCPAPAEIPRRACLPYTQDADRLLTRIPDDAPVAALLIAARYLPGKLIERRGALGATIMVADVPVPRVKTGWPRLPWYKKRLFGKIDHVFLASERGRPPWQGAGARDDQLNVIGTLAQTPPALQCNEAEREMLAGAFRHRTIWLAAGIPRSEEDLVIAAHRDALRESHRLALVLHPDDPMRGPALHARLAQHFTCALRSRDDPITQDTQVYIADTEGERGLWYRLAVCCYLGGGFTDGATLSPFEAAGLGCAIVHGPEGGMHGDAFELLVERRATRRLTRPDALGRMIRATLRPEQAAKLAHRGWQMVSEGAEATDKLVSHMIAATDRMR